MQVKKNNEDWPCSKLQAIQENEDHQIDIHKKLRLYFKSLLDDYRQTLSFIVQKNKLIKIIKSTISDNKIDDCNLQECQKLLQSINNLDKKYYAVSDYNILEKLIKFDRTLFNLLLKYYRDLSSFDSTVLKNIQSESNNLFSNFLIQVQITKSTGLYESYRLILSNNIKDEKQNFLLKEEIEKLQEHIPQLRDALNKFKKILEIEFINKDKNNEELPNDQMPFVYFLDLFKLENFFQEAKKKQIDEALVSFLDLLKLKNSFQEAQKQKIDIYKELNLYFTSLIDDYRQNLYCIVRKDQLIKIINSTISDKNINGDNLERFEDLCQLCNDVDKKYFSIDDCKKLIKLIISERALFMYTVQCSIIFYDQQYKTLLNNEKFRLWKDNIGSTFRSLIKQVEKKSVTLKYYPRRSKKANNTKDNKQNFVLMHGVKKLQEQIPQLKESLDKCAEILEVAFKNKEINKKSKSKKQKWLSEELLVSEVNLVNVSIGSVKFNEQETFRKRKLDEVLSDNVNLEKENQEESQHANSQTNPQLLNNNEKIDPSTLEVANILLGMHHASNEFSAKSSVLTPKRAEKTNLPPTKRRLDQWFQSNEMRQEANQNTLLPQELNTINVPQEMNHTKGRFAFS